MSTYYVVKKRYDNKGGYSSRAHLFPFRTEKLSLLAQMVLPLVGEYVAAFFEPHSLLNGVFLFKNK